MSITKTFKSNVFGKLNVEFYGSANQMADDLVSRSITDSRFKGDPYDSKSFVGASREDTYKMLREGYQPTVDALKVKIKTGATSKRFKSFNDVVGYQPIVPNAIMGLPNSMVNSSVTPIKTKVIDIYYDMTVSAGTNSKDLIAAGQKMLSVILEMEAQGYRFNLYVTQNYYDTTGCDMVCVKVKSANQPFDLKRMSFPVSHTAFFRGIGFDWYSKFPLGTYRFGYGHSVFYDKSNDVLQKECKRIFGKSATFFSATSLIKKKDEATQYVKEVLNNEKV